MIPDRSGRIGPCAVHDRRGSRLPGREISAPPGGTRRTPPPGPGPSCGTLLRIGVRPMSDRADEAPWIEGRTVGEVLRRTAHAHGERDAVVFPALSLRWSWADLDARVDRLASGLIGLGVRPGEHVGIWSMNAPEWVVTQFAA